jgi:hypothetical protein
VLQFYNVKNRAYFPYASGTDPLAHWIQFQTGYYQIQCAEFYGAQFRLQGDRYAGLLSAFNGHFYTFFLLKLYPLWQYVSLIVMILETMVY